MRARITDKPTLMSISPNQIMAYLRSKKAKLVDSGIPEAAVWEYGNEEIFVPQKKCFADYALRIADVLAQLEKVEERSQLLILEDLNIIGFDIIRVRNVSEDTLQGSMNLVKSVDFVAGTKDMLLAAACAAATHKISYPRKKPQNAEAFLENVQFGQTARGSFILQLLSPVLPELNMQNKLIEIMEAEPYEKTVIPMLQSGLESLNVAAQRASVDDNLDHFQEAAKSGLTTNLCDAVTGIYDSLKPKYIEIAITYSTNRKDRYSLARISVDSGYIPIIRSASTMIKANEPESEDEQLVRGPIVKLISENPAEGGEITIKDLMTQQPRSLVAQLPGAEYKKAVDAHKKHQLVEISGKLIKYGRTYRLIPETSLTFIDIQ